MNPWARSFRRGSRRAIQKALTDAKQLEFFLEALRIAYVDEDEAKRPRRWLLVAIQERLSALAPRMELLGRIDAVRQLHDYRRECRGPFTPAEARPFFDASTDFHRLMPRDHVPLAPQVASEEAFRWLDQLPEDARLHLYSSGSHRLYFGLWERNAGGAA